MHNNILSKWSFPLTFYQNRLKYETFIYLFFTKTLNICLLWAKNLLIEKILGIFFLNKVIYIHFSYLSVRQ